MLQRKAEGRRLLCHMYESKLPFMGIKPCLKEELYQRKVRQIQTLQKLSSTFFNVGSFCPLSLSTF
jgi:hypothetical protein